MKNSIRQCISCILPCGALDVIRIIHSNGRVEEITSGTIIKASDIMKAHPKHVLKKPRSPSSVESVATRDCGVPGIVIVPPEAELQRGKIYFLTPLPPSPQKQQQQQRRKKQRKQHKERRNNNNNNNNSNSISMNNFLVSDRYLTEILSEKVSMPSRDRRRGRVAVWRPNLESISESPSDL